MSTHSFTASLDLSTEHARAPWWDDCYQAAFPDLAAHSRVERDGWGQRGGVDRVLTLQSGKTLTVDEKVRAEDWPDFALEYWSDVERRIEGWAIAELACDYIAYAFIPSGRCYLLPFQELRRAMRVNGPEWVRRYRKPWHKADNRRGNRTWQTHFVPVPIEVVLEALADSMLVRFNAPAEAA